MRKSSKGLIGEEEKCVKLFLLGITRAALEKLQQLQILPTVFLKNQRKSKKLIEINQRKTATSQIQQPSLKKNYILSTIRLALSFALPLVSFPYVSRILGSAGIGKVEFANSVVAYFVLFTGLGIPNYGMRLAACEKRDIFRLSKSVAELSLILLFTVVAGYAVYFLLLWIVPDFRSERLLFLIVSPSIFLSDFNFEWFYQGIENQKFITVRYIIIKILQLACIFLFVRERSQYLLYAALLVGMNSLSTLFNIFHLRKYLVKIPVRNLELKPHLKPVILIFASNIAVSVYTNLDVIMVGFFCGDEKVGLYTAANRIVRIVIAVVTAFSAVIVPRIESSLKTGDIEGYRRYVNLSLGYILILAVPCCLGIIALASDIIMVFAGAEFAPSIFSIQLLSPIIIIVGLAYFVGLQLLYSHREEWKYTVSVSVAAVVNAIFNALLIPRFAQNGAVAGTLIAEGTGLVVQIVFAWKYLKETDFLSGNTLKYVLAGVIMFVAVRLVPELSSRILRCALCVVLGVAVYGAGLLLMREKMAWKVMGRLAGKIRSAE